MPHPAFAAWEFGDIARGLADVLAECRAECEPVARAMHEKYTHGHKTKVHVYESDPEVARRSQPFDEAFPTWESFLIALRDESPGAFEAAFEVLGRAAPDAALPFALQAIELQPRLWKALRMAVARALAWTADERGLQALLTHSDEYTYAACIGKSRCSTMLEQVRARYGKDPYVTKEVLTYIGHHRLDAGWQLVVQHYREHGDMAAGHALFGFGDARSWDLLESLLHGNSTQRFFAVKTCIARGNVLEKLGDTDNEAVASELLHSLARAVSKEGLAPDPRYAELARRWVKTKATKDNAQYLLYVLRPPKPATSPKPKTVPKPSPEMLEVMTRARGNLERIVACLKKEKYRFVRPRAVLAKPTAKSKRDVLKLEKLVGPLPPALRAAFEVIVACDLRGTHGSFACTASIALPGESEKNGVWYTDPFVLIPPSVVLEDAEDHADDEADYTLVWSGDAVAKAGYSGGQYSLDMSDDGSAFVAELRRVFEWGGFPGFSAIDAPLPALVKTLKELCKPI